MVDQDDWPLVSQYRWFAALRRGVVYVQAHIPGTGKHGRKIFLHHLLIPDVPLVDHINRNGLDNRRANLRPASRTQNQANAKIRVNKTSRYKGVFWVRQRQRWVAATHCHGRKYHLGTFLDEGAAAVAYNAAAVRLFGEFARLNIVED